MYVVTLDALNNPLAPAVATDLVVEINTNASSSRFDAVPNHFIRFSRGMSETAAGTDALARSLVVGRALGQTVSGVDSLARTYHAKRGPSETTSVADALARSLVLGRALGESAPTTSSLARAVVVGRPLSESAPTSDELARALVLGRALSESTPAADGLARTYHAVRSLPESTSVADAIARALVLGRALNEPYPTTPELDRQINMIRTLREYPPGVAPDWLVEFPEREITGVVRDSNGTPVAGATVKLFRMSDDKMVDATTSDGDGAYSFVRDVLDPNTYYTLAYVDDEVHGVSDRDLAPTSL
jgi:hypothetical protein